MARPKTIHETATTTACMRISKAVKAAQRLATADGQSEHAADVLNVTRAEAVRAIAAAMPLLTAEQREQLRPILSGSIPADTSRADSTAA